MSTILGPTKSLGHGGDLTIRQAGSSDALAVYRLAALDSTRVPRGRVLLAEVGGEPWAAVSIDEAHAVADPFRPSGELVLMLLERARQIRRAEKRERGHDRGRRRRAWRPAVS